MGDKGKKDKDKGRKQKINKQEQKAKEKIGGGKGVQSLSLTMQRAHNTIN
jgi:hypothetical protein